MINFTQDMDWDNLSYCKTTVVCCESKVILLLFSIIFKMNIFFLFSEKAKF